MAEWSWLCAQLCQRVQPPAAPLPLPLPVPASAPSPLTLTPLTATTTITTTVTTSTSPAHTTTPPCTATAATASTTSTASSAGANGQQPLMDADLLVEMINTIVQRASDFHDYNRDEHENFYTPFLILSAYYINQNVSSLRQEHLGLCREALRIILQHLVDKLREQAPNYSFTITDNAVSTRQLITIIGVLCGVENLEFQLNDLVFLLLLTRSSECPVKPTPVQNERAVSQRRTESLAEVLLGPPHVETLSTNVSFMNVAQAPKEVEGEGAPSSTGATPTTVVTTATFDYQRWLHKTCISLLGPIPARDVFLNICKELSSYRTHSQPFITSMRANIAKSSRSQWSSNEPAQTYDYRYPAQVSVKVSELGQEMQFCAVSLSIPCYEPLTPETITALSELNAGWLFCAASIASLYPKDEETEKYAAELVEDSVCLFENVGDNLKNSIRAGGHVYQNHLMIGTWVLLSHLHTTLMGSASSQTPTPHSTPGKSPKSTSQMFNFTKMQQGLHVTWVALGAKCLEGVKTLLADARLEAQALGPNANTQSSGVPASLNPNEPHSARERADRLTSAAPLHQLLVILGVVCYRKATTLKRAVVQKQHEADADHSDSTVYYQDMIMCSEDSETEDEDSEPLLGLWFESTLVAPEGNENSAANTNDEIQTTVKTSSIVPDKAEPYSYIKLAIQVFRLLESEVVNGASWLGESACNLTENEIVLLATLVKDLDRETARTDMGTISSCFGPVLGNLYSQFSSAVVRYLHALTSKETGQHLKDVLLEHLGVSSTHGEDGKLMPLQVGCRVLKLIGTMILSKPVVEKEASILSLWNNTIKSLVEHALQPQPSPDHEYEDMNVEHAQLLVYLFHSLNLMQKKSVLLMISNAIIKVMESLDLANREKALRVMPHQLLLTTRMVLLLEYIMKHLYNAPQWLLQQIEYNLVIAPGLSSNNDPSKYPAGTTPGTTRIYCAVPQVEQVYRRRTSQDMDMSMRPKFYALSNTDVNNQETPKLDGLACNFVLGTPDKMKYPSLLDALLNLLHGVALCDKQPPVSHSALCIVHYTFQTTFRMIITMPPSIPHMEDVAEANAPLHALIWGPRANNQKTFSPWLKDSLVKQGMYTQFAENLLSNVSSTCENIAHIVWVATKNIQKLKEHTDATGMPSMYDIITVGCTLMRLRLSLCDESLVAVLAATNADTQLTKQFMPHLLDLIETLFTCCRNVVVREITSSTGSGTVDDVNAMAAVEACGGPSLMEVALRCCGARDALWIRNHLPQTIRTILDKAAYFQPPTFTLKPPIAFLNDPIPSESAILQQISMNSQLISGGGVAAALRPLLFGAVELLATRVTSLLEPECAENKERAISILLPATVDGRLSFIRDIEFTALSTLLSSAQKVEQMIHEEMLRNMYPTLIEPFAPNKEKILRSMIKYIEKILERPAGKEALDELFDDEKMCLGEILMASADASPSYASRVIRLFNKIFSACESPDGVSSFLCASICRRLGAPSRNGTQWTRTVCLGAPSSGRVASTPSESEVATPTAPPTVAPAATAGTAGANNKADGAEDGSNNSSPAPRNADTVQQSESCSWSGGVSDSKESVAIAPLGDPSDNTENATLLSNLTKHITLHCDESVSLSLLSSLVQLAPEALIPGHAGLPLPRLLKEAARLADAHTGRGHKVLFPAAVTWLNTCVESLCAPDVLERLEDGCMTSHRSHLEAACHLLAYVTDALYTATACGTSGNGSLNYGTALAVRGDCTLPPLNWDTPQDLPSDIEWPDDQQDDDDISADDSDEDSMLHLKLCTFTTTATEYMNQHWYHCHTCKMVDGVGVCTVCALVCHRDHDVSYAKYGNFFCDCGAKEDSTCQALVKRSSSHSTATRRNTTEPEQPPPSSLRRRPSSPLRAVTPPQTRKLAYASNIQGVRDLITQRGSWGTCIGGLQKLLSSLLGPVKASCEKHSPVGRHGRARRALAQLHHGDKRFHATDQLMMATLGSQEGAFENVRMSYTGEQGQAIRQLITAHMVRRVAMCCLALPHGRRQHLAVSHEKGKITILQLSTLLKQADSAKRKLTLTKLTAVPVPFTVLSLSSSSWNEDVLAACGLRDCHVISFTGGNSPVYERIVLQPFLDPGNFIIRSIWLPGTQTQLALVTADFVKIYDLAKNAVMPEYHFLVPCGKVRDVTFVSHENVMYMLCMGSAGHIYWQAMTEDSHTTNGPFYITNTVEIKHPDIKVDSGGHMGGGGVSIYYSHTMKMLFFSYAQGKSCMAPLTSMEEPLKNISLITLGSNSGTSSQKESSRNKGAQSLCQWQEVPGHPGLITAVLQASNNPVVLMLKPGSIAIQEIKITPKSKITDVVIVRHTTSQEPKSTLILLCEDGSLRIYTANPEQTGYWLSPAVAPPASSLFLAKPKRTRSVQSKHKGQTTTGKSSNAFPIDFFEHCSTLTDVVFGGNDLLQVYNTAQIKHRLATNGLYVVSTKMSGFTIEITNPDPSTVITGIRVQLGTQDINRSPSHIEICGRTIQTSIVRSRWYDIPLTREESLQVDKKLCVSFGPSQDPEGVIMVDSIKVYGRNKDVFGWPEENEEGAICPTTSKAQENEGGQSSVSWSPPGVERLACSVLESLELSLMAGAAGGAGTNTDVPRDAATILLCTPCPMPLHTGSKALLQALLGQNYHAHKDQAILAHVTEQLIELRETPDPRNADPENFFRVVMLARAIAVSRPQNLLKYAGNLPTPPEDPKTWDKMWCGETIDSSIHQHLALLLTAVLWRLESVHGPMTPLMLSSVDRCGLRNTDHLLHAIVDIVHAFMLNGDQNMVELGNRIYISLLLSEDQVISFGVKNAIMRVLRPRIKKRRVYIPSPPATPGVPPGRPAPLSILPRSVTPPPRPIPDSPTADHNDNEAMRYVSVDEVVDMSRLLGTDEPVLESLLLNADADDETMVELAIVLSLQERAAAVASAQGGSGAPSDATASAAGSDDDDTAAPPPVISPAEPPGSAGSESGGSGADSIGGVSGRSSAYEPVTRTAGDSCALESSHWAGESGAGGAEVAARVRVLRLELLHSLLSELPQLRNIGGVRSIPLMQILLMLGASLDSALNEERQALQKLLEALGDELELQDEQEVESDHSAHSRSPKREVQFLILRFLSVLMSRCKTPGPAPSTSRATQQPGPAEWHTARATADTLLNSGALKRCEVVLKGLLPYWREQAARAEKNTPSTSSALSGNQTNAIETTNSATLLRPQPPYPLPDMQPFFLRQYVKSHAWDVMENYPHILTEVALRLPYQIHKYCDPPAPPFPDSWNHLLCEYMMCVQTPVIKKQVRRLLLVICATKDRYRQLRDVHALTVHLQSVRDIVGTSDSSYDSMVQLMDHLKACVEIAVNRTGNWQYLCIQGQNVVSYLMNAACILGEGVAPTALQLVQMALCAPPPPPAIKAVPAIAANDRNDRERSADSDISSSSTNSKFQEALVPQLVAQIQQQISIQDFKHFVRVFLLETNSTAVRWQAHALLLAIYDNSTEAEQTRFAHLMWEMWPTLPQYGRKMSQFVDLLGYSTLKTPNLQIENYLASAVNLLKEQNNLLASHSNGPIYSALSNYVELDGYYLESEPCLVCNNPEVPMSTIKLSTIRIDSKYTTTTQIVKLVGSHTISRISLRIGDLKRSKMVRAINIFYNNRSVQAVQELKNKPGMWHKAKHVVLTSGQTEVRMDFPLPIVACNLMMEYADFYENAQASGESLQCPRCSAPVPANPGVCANCGENVFQCHKCRAINYDEKDPFLCHSCGFCKYAKFDYSLLAKPCCAVESIENDEDRKKMVTAIGVLLDKADRVYRQLVANKPIIENMLHKITEHRLDGGSRGLDNMVNEGVASGGGSAANNAQVNKVIQYVAHKYCIDSKNHFDDLSKIIQRVLTCRRELVAYDKSQNEQFKIDNQYSALTQTRTEKIIETNGGHCYGCALSAASHCLTLLRALASSPDHRQKLCQLGLVQELVQHNLRRGTPQSQEEVRQLICVVTRDNLVATKALCKLLSQRITLGLLGHAAAQDHTSAVRPLILLLGGLVKMQDNVDCWEVRLRCIVRLWVWCCPYLSTTFGGVIPVETDDTPPPPLQLYGNSQDAYALQQVALPCLQYLHQLMQPDSPPTKHKSSDPLKVDPSQLPGPPLDLKAWLSGRTSYADWKRHRPVPIPAPAADAQLTPQQLRDDKLAMKYVARWKDKVARFAVRKALSLGNGGWLQPVMFNPSSKMARDTACQMVKSLCIGYERTKAFLVLLTSFLPEIGTAGEASEQFLQLYQSLASESPWLQFLALKGVLLQLADLLTKEIDHLHKLEETTLTSDLAQGYALKKLTVLLAMFLEDSRIRHAYKGRLMGAVLGGYLSLRMLVVQRTRLIDDTQEKLLELLEEMTTGTEAETAEFMEVCIETVKKYSLHDFRTPVFIFERLCSIIYPEENDVGEFFLTLDKDPQQEDFLQGRMLGNPYSSLEAGLGPLMRDVKNKICADCELVALLEDDNGMELLVNNKIMSLDLPVKEVYKKVWLASGESDAMRVVYRMRGLMGDATEEFVETLSAASTDAVDDEQVYRMANVLADCGGLEVMLERLAIASGAGGVARPLSKTLLRLLSLCVHVRRCVAVLIMTNTRAMPALLRALQLNAKEEATSVRPELTSNLLEIMDRILSVAAGKSLESFLQFSLTFGGTEYVQALLNCTECPGIRANAEALGHLTRVLAALVYGNDLKMAHLCQHFKQVLDFNKFDSERLAEDEFRMELFCVLCTGIERNAIGGTLKDYLISLGIVKNALDYIQMHAPCVKPTLLRTDSDELKEFISKPALKYILRFLTGLAHDHEPTRMAVCEKVIPIVHRLEQVSSDEHVGSLAENLLEALMSEPEAAKKVQEVRDYTRQEKKRLAMAMREKQLGALGMRTNDKGQVTAQCSLTQQVQELGEETGAVCCICREGYKYQPTKVLGIYTFTKRCGVEEFEMKARKTLGYTTVTHFNIVHVECHMAAVRQARVSRDEWESAALQNASTRCNGLLPLWGPHVPESAFASCLARHNTYLQECTGHRDISYQCTVHDLKLLLMRFAREKSFHEDTGGGGPLSNMQLVPCLAHMALYVINTTRVASREVANLQSYMEWPMTKQVESSFDAEGPLYYAVLALLLQPADKWREERLEHLRRILVAGHSRAVFPSGAISRQADPSSHAPRAYEVYKPYLMFFSLIQLLYDVMFKSVPSSPAEQWPVKLAEAIRHGDEAVLRNSESILSTFTEELLPCTSFEEWCDAAGLLRDIHDPTAFLEDTLKR